MTPVERSPYGLIQEELRNEPWKLLVCCMFLNLTNIKQVRCVVDAFFTKWPTPEAAASANIQEMIEVIHSLGFYNRRAATIIKMSRAFIDGVDVKNLPGVGRYALDSYMIFVNGSLDVQPTDKKLIKYVQWASSIMKRSTSNDDDDCVN